mgnify:CR=1 FL=1
MQVITSVPLKRKLFGYFYPPPYHERGFGMKTNKTIEIHHIPWDKLKNMIRTPSGEGSKGLTLPNLPSDLKSNSERELMLIGIFVLGELVGITYYWFEPTTGTGFIDRLSVSPDLHRLGYGCAALTKAVEQLSKIPECKRIRTSFVPSNPIIETLYYSLGFRRTGETVGEEVITVMDMRNNK